MTSLTSSYVHFLLSNSMSCRHRCPEITGRRGSREREDLIDLHVFFFFHQLNCDVTGNGHATGINRHHYSLLFPQHICISSRFLFCPFLCLIRTSYARCICRTGVKNIYSTARRNIREWVTIRSRRVNESSIAA